MMTPRARVLAALRRQPVDRIPYCEHMFDARVAAQIAGGIERLTSNQQAIELYQFKSSTLFSPKMYRDLMLPYTRKVAEKISIPWIYHSDGNIAPILDDLLTQGMNAIHPLEPDAVDPVALKKRYGDRLAFVGNINVDTLTRGTPTAVTTEVRERIAQLGPGYGYLLSTSNSVTGDSKPENVGAMLAALRQYGRYPHLTAGTSRGSNA